MSICANTSLYHWLAVLSYQCLSFPLCAHELPVALAAVSPVLHSSVAELCSSRVRYVDGTAVCCESLRGDTGERSVSDTALHSHSRVHTHYSVLCISVAMLSNVAQMLFHTVCLVITASHSVQTELGYVSV